jgi:Tfp pilus assembly protein PilF
MQKAKSEKAIVIAKITPDFVMQSINAPAAHKPPPNIAVAGQDPLTQGGYQMLLQKNWKAASEILATAIKRTPRDWSARRFYAAAMMEMGRYGEAMQSFDVMASNRAILPSDEMAYAECAAKAGKTERALELYNGCLNRDPTFLEARVAMIRLCVQKGFASKAQQLVKEGTTMQPATKDTLQKALAGN